MGPGALLLARVRDEKSMSTSSSEAKPLVGSKDNILERFHGKALVKWQDRLSVKVRDAIPKTLPGAKPLDPSK